MRGVPDWAGALRAGSVNFGASISFYERPLVTRRHIFRFLKAFGLTSSKKTILVIGGSLGARRINQLIESNLRLFKDLEVEVPSDRMVSYPTQVEIKYEGYIAHELERIRKTVSFMHVFLLGFLIETPSLGFVVGLSK